MRRLAVTTSALLLAFLGVTSAGAADRGAPAAPGSKASSAGQEHRAAQARAALAAAQEILAGAPAGHAREDHGHGREATLALRDLALLKGDLAGDDRAEAESYLARPTDNYAEPFEDAPKYGTAEEATACGEHVCVHYVTTGPHAVDPADTLPGNGVPDYVDLALSTVESVHSSYVAAGYRPPKSDETSPRNGKNDNDPVGDLVDIYLADIGDQGYYGYCTTDDPNASRLGSAQYPHFDVSAFCVLDEDYLEFPGQSPEANLQVTAAHEYFHAVQFGYDISEDSWLMEGTAAWVEDEVFDDINDNRQYLAASPLRQPASSLDTGISPRHYGAWIYWRYLSERNPVELGGLPTIIREVWERVDSSAAAAHGDDYSVQAVRNALAARGKRFATDFSRFAADNRHPGISYEEGTEYTASPVAKAWGLSTGTRSTSWQSTTLNHLANATVRFTPHSTLSASDFRLRLHLDLPSTAIGTAATVQVYPRSGAVGVYPVTLDAYGNATRTFPFAVGDVRFVEVTLTNASTRFTCWRGTVFSCQGAARDNRLVFRYHATAYRS